MPFLSLINAILGIPSPKPTPSFLDLPGELRNQIYASAPTKDLLPLFQTCKQIRREGLPRMFVLYIGSWAHPSPLPSPRRPATELIQNLCLYINLTDRRVRAYPPKVIATAFGGNAIIRENCHLFLDFGRNDHIAKDIGKTELFESLRSLTGFKMVMVEVQFTRYEMPRILRRLPGYADGEDALNAQKEMILKFDVMCALEEGLGRGDYYCGNYCGVREERQIRFRPIEERL